MTTTASNGPPHGHLFKPYLKHKAGISHSSSQMLTKRYYKFLHHFYIAGERCCCCYFGTQKYHPPRIPKLKYLHSIHHKTSHLPEFLPFWQKSVKLYQRSLKNVHRSLESPRIQRLLPCLEQLNVHDDPETWKVLVSRLAFKTLIFDLNSREDQMKWYNLLIKYRSALSRNLHKMKELASLVIEAVDESLELALFLLEIISKNDKIEPLKSLSLHLHGGPQLNNPKSYAKNSKALEFLTKLEIENAKIYSSFFSFSAGEFKNLSHLVLNISPQEESWDFGQLAHFKDFPMVQKFVLHFTACSYVSETQFFRNFTVPPTLEDFDLTLANFTWNELPVTDENRNRIKYRFENDPLYKQFFWKLQDSQKVKDLNLTITQPSKTENTPSLNAKFASSFIKCFTKLEKVSYRSFQTGGRFPEHKRIQAKVAKLLRFEDLWRALERSKETLTAVSLCSPEVAFPESIGNLEVGFSKLQSLTLKEKICCPIELSQFCRSLLNLKQIRVDRLVLKNEERMRGFLNCWKEIPKGMDVSFDLTARHIKEKKVLVDCLMEYIPQVRNEGILRMQFLVSSIYKSSDVDVLRLCPNREAFQAFRISIADKWNTNILTFV